MLGISVEAQSRYDNAKFYCSEKRMQALNEVNTEGALK